MTFFFSHPIISIIGILYLIICIKTLLKLSKFKKAIIKMHQQTVPIQSKCILPPKPEQWSLPITALGMVFLLIPRFVLLVIIAFFYISSIKSYHYQNRAL